MSLVHQRYMSLSYYFDHRKKTQRSKGFKGELLITFYKESSGSHFVKEERRMSRVKNSGLSSPQERRLFITFTQLDLQVNSKWTRKLRVIWIFAFEFFAQQLSNLSSLCWRCSSTKQERYLCTREPPKCLYPVLSHTVSSSPTDVSSVFSLPGEESRKQKEGLWDAQCIVFPRGKSDMNISNCWEFTSH